MQTQPQLLRTQLLQPFGANHGK